MSPTDLARDAAEALAAGTHMTLVRRRGAKTPKGFPRGELLCENADGRNVYSYDPLRVLAWMKANGFVEIKTEVAS